MIYAFEEFEFDADRLELRRSGAVTKVEPLLLRVLATLVRSAGRLVTKSELSQDVWAGRAIADNVITLSMGRLRKALLQRRGEREFIVTVHGLGYRFVSPVVVRNESRFSSRPAALVQEVAPPFVGRAGLLGELRQCFVEAQRGHGRLCVLMGEPGIGKTHVVTALTDELAASGVQVAWGFCRESGSTPPLYPWLQLLRRLFETAPEQAWNESLGPVAAELRGLLYASERPSAVGEAGSRAGSQTPRVAYLHNMGVIPRVFVQTASSTPWVLVLEDLHRADAATLEMLSLLVDEIGRSRLLVLATVRDPLTGRILRPSTPLPYILGHRNTERFILKHLSESDVVEYVAAIIPDADGQLGRAVYAKSLGNPFFMAELSRQLRRDGKTDPEHLVLPNAALDIIRQHVAALDAETSSLLKVAAVIGVQFELALLQTITGQDASALARSLDEALEANLLVTLSDSSATFAFRHELLRAVLYESIPPLERRSRHLEIALAMERRAATTHVAVPVSELADHFYAALPDTDLEKTVRYCDEAARAACAVFANTDVARHMRQALAALALMPAPPLSLRLGLLFRLSLYTRGSAPELFVKTVQEVVRLASECGDTETLVRSARMHCVHPELSALPGATEALEHALTIIPESQAELRAMALATLATAAPRAYSARESRACLDEAEALARAAEHEDGLVIVLVCRSFSDGGPGCTPSGLLDELERLAKQTQRAPMVPVFLAMHRAMHALQSGDQTALSASIESGLSRARAVRHPEVVWYFERFQALAKINAGDCDEGKRQLEALHARSDTLLGAATFCAFDRLVVLAELGERSEVDDALRRALAYQPWDPPGVWALKVRSLAAAGLIDDARSSLAAVPASKLHELPCDSQFLGTLGHLARTALTIGARDYIEVLDVLLAPYDGYFAGHASLFCDGAVAQLRGMLAAARGRPREARGLLERGLQMNERARYVVCAAEARLELAKCLRGLDRGAARRLASECRALSEKHGLRVIAQRAARLLAEPGSESLSPER